MHIGAHKTGSTAIQYVLSENRERFKEVGILVPDAGRPVSAPRGNHELAWAIYRDRSLLNTWNDLAIETAESGLKIIVVSSEEFDRATKENVDEIRKLTNAYDTTVLLYIRRQVDSCEAFYRTIVEHYGYARSIREYAEEHVSNFDCYNIIRRWASVFPHDRLIVRLYSPNTLINGDIIDDFFYVLRIEKHRIPKLPGVTINHGLPAIAITLIRLLSKHRYPKDVIKDFRMWSYRNLCDLNLKYTFLNPTESRSIMKRFEVTNREIRDQYFPDRPEELFDPFTDSERFDMDDFDRIPELKIKVQKFFDERGIKLSKEVADFLS